MRAVRVLLIMFSMAFVLAVFQVNALLRTSDNYGLQTDVTDQGGTKSTSTNYIVRQGSAGQLGAIGSSGSSNYIAGQGYIYTTNTKPATPESLAQYKADGVTPIPWPGGTTNTTTEVMKFDMHDPDPGDVLTPQIEVVLSGESFSDSPSFEGGNYDYSGTPVNGSLEAAGMEYGFSYIWQARVKDQEKFYSDWVKMGGAPDYFVLAALGVSLRNAGDTADYTTWEVGTGKELNTVYIMSNTECVLAKNNGDVAEDFGISAEASSWTLGSTNEGTNQCILMGLFNRDAAPAAGDYSTDNDLVGGSLVWATSDSGNGKFEGTNSGANVAKDMGEKLYMYLKTPQAVDHGAEEVVKVTIGCQEH